MSPNILRSKGNQTMKFGQLIEYNKGNIFLKKSNTKCDGETSPRYFSEKLGLSISLNQGFIKFVFVVCQDDGYGNVLKLSCRPHSFTSY